VVDTSYILGGGSVKDTYNLLGDGIRKLVGALAAIVPLTSPISGQVSTASNTTLARVSRGRRASTGTIPRHEKCSCKVWLRMRIAC
jgi:hypothetical protein